MRARLPLLVEQLAAARRRRGDDDQRGHAAPARRRAAGGRAAAGQHQPRHARPRAVRGDDPARRARPRARRHRRRPRGRVRPGEDQHRRAARRQRRRARRPRRRSGAASGVEVRFIEFMPLDASGGWADGPSSARTRSSSASAPSIPLEQLPARGAAPADRWRYLDGVGTVGVIPSVTKPFCGDCDRVRLTADGQFRTCLFATDEFDLRLAMRAGRDRRRAGRPHRARGRHEVGRPQDQPDRLRPPEALDEPDRRLIGRSERHGPCALRLVGSSRESSVRRALACMSPVRSPGPATR